MNPVDMSTREIRLPLDEVVAIGSREASGTADDSTVGRFVTDCEVARRLAHARRVISVALEDASTAPSAH